MKISLVVALFLGASVRGISINEKIYENIQTSLKDSGEPSNTAETWDVGEKGTSDDEKSSRAAQAKWEADNVARKAYLDSLPPDTSV